MGFARLKDIIFQGQPMGEAQTLINYVHGTFTQKSLFFNHLPITLYDTCEKVTHFNKSR